MSEATGIDTAARPSGAGCLECGEDDGWWFHLRRCAECGHVGCCDSSPSQHATAHYRETGHRFMQSYEPGEDWFWDYQTEEMVDGPRLADPTSHPDDQPAPGPEGRVPPDWQRHLHA
ncbi:UBP-type zinc finger domain-containing protein [Humibacter sp. RRB41]|uniref:UBP-type zinc finger domain-containing protein n=1 Tax=Humibacter sp. RRB41 TaxID=2919946 RepID=UPI001FA9B72D|nr:UBP-type zinc finger domain-containing protein [Humibacter sp. RRB41]